MLIFDENHGMEINNMSTQEHELRKAQHLTKPKFKKKSSHTPSSSSSAINPAINVASGKQSPPTPPPLTCKTDNLKFLNFLNALQSCRNFTKQGKYPQFLRPRKHSYSDGSVDYQSQDFYFRVSPANNEYGYSVYRLNSKLRIMENGELQNGLHFQLKNDELVFPQNTRKVTFGTGIGSQSPEINKMYDKSDSSQSETDLELTPTLKRTRSDASTPVMPTMEEDEPPTLMRTRSTLKRQATLTASKQQPTQPQPASKVHATPPAQPQPASKAQATPRASFVPPPMVFSSGSGAMSTLSPKTIFGFHKLHLAKANQELGSQVSSSSSQEYDLQEFSPPNLGSPKFGTKKPAPLQNPEQDQIQPAIIKPKALRMTRSQSKDAVVKQKEIQYTGRKRKAEEADLSDGYVNASGDANKDANKQGQSQDKPGHKPEKREKSEKPERTCDKPAGHPGDKSGDRPRDKPNPFKKQK